MSVKNVSDFGKSASVAIPIDDSVPAMGSTSRPDWKIDPPCIAQTGQSSDGKIGCAVCDITYFFFRWYDR